jgi:hypothetical protein
MGIEHCLVPFHIFLDKGHVSTQVNMHPIVLHATWLSSEVQNGSGNGGGIIIGFMPIVCYHSLQRTFLIGTPD